MWAELEIFSLSFLIFDFLEFLQRLSLPSPESKTPWSLCLHTSRGLESWPSKSLSVTSDLLAAVAVRAALETWGSSSGNFPPSPLGLVVRKPLLKEWSPSSVCWSDLPPLRMSELSYSIPGGIAGQKPSTVGSEMLVWNRRCQEIGPLRVTKATLPPICLHLKLSTRWIPLWGPISPLLFWNSLQPSGLLCTPASISPDLDLSVLLRNLLGARGTLWKWICPKRLAGWKALAWRLEPVIGTPRLAAKSSSIFSLFTDPFKDKLVEDELPRSGKPS